MNQRIAGTPEPQHERRNERTTAEAGILVIAGHRGPDDGGDGDDPALAERLLARVPARLSGLDERLVIHDVHARGPALDEVVARRRWPEVERVVAVGDAALRRAAVRAIMAVDDRRRPALGWVSTAAVGASTDLDPLMTRLRHACVAPTRLVDVGRWLPAGRARAARAFLGAARGGAIVERGAFARHRPGLLGGLAFGLAGVLGLPAMRPSQLELRGEGFAWSGVAYAVAIANAPVVTDGVCLCPDASCSDGQLDVTIIPASLDLAAVLQLIDERSVAALPGVLRFRSAWAELRAQTEVHLDIDGELEATHYGRFEVDEGALELIAPAA